MTSIMTNVSHHEELDYVLKVPLKVLKIEYCDEDDVFDFDMTEEVPRDYVPLRVGCQGTDSGDEVDTAATDASRDQHNHKNDFVRWLFHLIQHGLRSETLEVAVLIFNRFCYHINGRLKLHEHEDFAAASLACLIEATPASGHANEHDAYVVACYQERYPTGLQRLAAMTALLPVCNCTVPALFVPRAMDFVPILLALIPPELLPDTVRNSVLEIAMDQCETSESSGDLSTLARPSMVALCAIVNASQPFALPNDDDDSCGGNSILDFLSNRMVLDGGDALMFSLMDSLAAPMRDMHAAVDAEIAGIGAKKRTEEEWYTHYVDSCKLGYDYESEYPHCGKKRRFF